MPVRSSEASSFSRANCRDGFQESKARHAVTRLGEDERLVAELRQDVENVGPIKTVSGAHGFASFEGRAPTERGETTEQHPLRG